MSDVKPRGASITLDGQEHHLLFTLNAIDDLQDMYEDKNVYEILQASVGQNCDMEMLRDVLMVLLNDEAERNERLTGNKTPRFTKRDVGSMIGRDNFGDVMVAALQAYGVSMPEADEDESPNPESGQSK